MFRHFLFRSKQSFYLHQLSFTTFTIKGQFICLVEHVFMKLFDPYQTVFAVCSDIFLFSEAFETMICQKNIASFEHSSIQRHTTYYTTIQQTRNIFSVSQYRVWQIVPGCSTTSGRILQYAGQHAFLALPTHNPLRSGRYVTSAGLLR